MARERRLGKKPKNDESYRKAIAIRWNVRQSHGPEQREILNLFFEASLCLARFKNPQETLPELFKILSPIIPIQAAIFFEQRLDRQDFFVWKDAAHAGLDEEAIRMHAVRSFTFLSGQATSYSSVATSSRIESTFTAEGIPHTTTLPLVVDRQPIFGLLQVGCRQMDEKILSILNAIGNQLALALDRHYQLQLRREHFLREQAALEAARQAEAQRASEFQFRILAESVPINVWVVDARGDTSYVNQRWTESTGLSIQESAGDGWWQALHPEDKAYVEAVWQNAVTQQTSYQAEHRLRDTQGGYRWHLSRAVPDRNEEGDIFRWIGTSMDIDDQKRFEAELMAAKLKAEAANLAKSEFIATMSHEIRTPIGIIMGSAELLLDKEREEEKRSMISNIKRNSDTLLSLVNEILDLSKIEAGHLEVERVDVETKKFIDEIFQNIRFKAQEKGIDFCVSYEYPLPDRIHTDPNRFRQIALNIVGNAIKFTEKGEVSVSIRMIPHSQQLECTVRDTGIGVNADQQTRIWEPFVQADTSTTRKYGGTGLGLTLSLRLARALGGDIVLDESIPGRGSVFRFDIDTGIRWEEVVAKQPQLVPDKRLVETTEEPEHRSLEGSKVLVVEDAPDNQYIIQKYLEWEGAEVVLASNGWEGIRSVEEGNYDIVLMDIQMPGMDGFQATEKLRSHNYEKPIIALSAHALKSEQAKAVTSGFDAYLIKPINRKILIRTLSEYLRKNNKKPGVHFH